jgi:DNA primase
MYNIEQLLDDYYVEHKSVNSRGFVPVICPMCGSDKFHGGINIEGYYVCWKCEYKNFYNIIKIFTGKHWPEIELEYKDDLNPREIYLLNHSDTRERPEKLVLPEGTGPLNDRAKKYLQKRRFDPDELSDLYKVQSTGIHGEYNFRIVFPIYFENRIISYTCRDYTGQSELRYFSCKESSEIIPHKSIVYGFDQVPEDHAIIVEGIFDKLRLGINAVALFGSSWTTQQLNLLGTFSRATIIFDNEVAAQDKAKKLGEGLSGLGVNVEIIDLTGIPDPDSLSNKDAEQLVMEIMR